MNPMFRAPVGAKTRELHQSLLGLMQVDEQALRQRQLEQQAWARDIIKRHLGFGQRLAIQYLTKQTKQECNQRELARSSFARLLEASTLCVALSLASV